LSSASRSDSRLEAPRETLIVGGGVAGLVVARRLALAGRSVRLLEASERLGGQLAPQHVAGVELDAAAESFATRGDAVVPLLAELGLDGDVVTPEPGTAWVQRARGGPVPLPAAGLLGIPADPRDPGVVEALGPRGALRAQGDELLPVTVGADARTLADLVVARMGEAVLDTLVAPVVRGVYSREARDLPLDEVNPRLRAALAEHGTLAGAVRALRAAAPAGSLVAGLRGGMFRLADALAAEVARLGVAIETGVTLDDIPGGAVLAAPRPGIPPAREVTLVTLVLEAPALDGAPRGSGLLVAEGSAVLARALTHLTAKWSWIAEALPGRHALRLSYDAPPADPVGCALADAATMFGVALPEPVDATVRTWARAARDPGGFSGPRVGEPVAGVGLASVIPHAERVAAELLDDSTPAPGQGRMDA
jgi:protoporphyrinogen/coproporphyrinogen III oxidase